MGAVSGRSTQSLERMNMRPGSFIPPEDPESLEGLKFRWRHAVVGAIVGAVVGLFGQFLEGHFVWWLAVPLGVLVGWLPMRYFDFPAHWGK